MLLITRNSGDSYSAKLFSTVTFIGCVDARDDKTESVIAQAFARGGHERIKSLRRNSQPDETAWCVGSGWWLSTTEVP